MAGSNNGESGTSQDAANVRWRFIDASNNSRSNLTQVKRHVMQEYMRQKKGSSRTSESEDDQCHPTKRGRPKKPRASQRKSTRRAADAKKDDSSESSQATVAKEQVLAAKTENGPTEIDYLSSVSDPSLAVEVRSGKAVALPIRTSPVQPHESSVQFHASIDLSPQSHGQWSDLQSFASWSSAPTTPFEFTKSPRTILSAARTDPFNSLPLELDLEGQRLFDFYVNEMPSCSYGTHFRSAKAHNWYTQVFVPEAMKGAVAFQNTILVHAANTWAWVRNETETSHTLRHRDRAITMLREHLSNNPRDNSDVAIISCLSAAALEDFDPRPGHKEISWVHMRAAREMIRSRGGPAAFAHTRLGMLINWQDYILSGYETHGCSFFFERTLPSSAAMPEPPRSPSRPSTNVYSMPSPPESTSSACSDGPSCPDPAPAAESIHTISPIDEIRLQCEEFLDFLRRCEQLALYQRDHPETCDLSRHTAVQGTSILHQILTAPPGARFTASGDRKQMVARLAALMMLNAALWDYRYTPAHAGTFLQTLEQAMFDSEVSMSGSVEAILQILLECNDGIVSPTVSELPDFSQYSPTSQSPSARPWFTGRMLKIAKRLSADSWHRVNDLLFSCLTLRVRSSSVYSWEADLRQEILEAPLTSYIMPSLLQ